MVGKSLFMVPDRVHCLGQLFSDHGHVVAEYIARPPCILRAPSQN